MLSLKRRIDGLDREEQRFQTVRDCYLGALHAMQEHAVEVSAEVVLEFQVRMRALHRELCDDATLATLEHSRATVSEALQTFHARSAESLRRKEEDLRGIIETLGSAAETLSGHNDTHSTRLKDFTTQLHLVSRGTDLGKMRLDLARKVAELRATTDSMWRENQSSVAEMHLQLAEFQKRLERAESRAAIDALTGLLNRGEGEAKLRQAVEAGRPVTVMLIDLNGFKQVNDRWGHSAGDQVLKTFAHTLSQNVRKGDSVCRWGGDEFLVIMSGNEETARPRAAGLRSKLRIMHKLVVLGRIVDVEVGASMGLAQARTGEPIEDLLTRADVELYGHKNQGTGRIAPMTILEGGA